MFFEDVIIASEKIYHQPQFVRSAAHIYYAIALEQTGNDTKAEKEFLLMKARFSNYEARYQYGLFLERKERKGEAKDIFLAMVDEYHHLSAVEKRSIRQWIALSKEELKKMTS
jgi:hypothetical protein